MTPAVLITGASSGIGRAVSMRLSRQHGHLVIGGRDRNALEETARLCATGAACIPWVCDLDDPATIENSLGNLLRDHDLNVTGFVHVAGRVRVQPTRLETTASLLETFNVNFFSAAEICRMLISKKSNNKALIATVFISSIYARTAAKGHAAYCASKAALDGYMRALAAELAPMRFNSVLPGGIRTKMSGAMLANPELAAKTATDYPLGIGEPEDIAAAVDWLLSDDARWITGAEFIIDGGRLCHT